MELNKIHEDNRGSIHAITGNPLVHPEVSFLHTKAGLARGGCIHRINTEHLTVIEGMVEYYYRLPDEKKIRCIILSNGEGISIPPNTPHYMISLNDSIIIEWGCDPSEKKEKHEEFRKIVVAHNEKLQS